MTREDIFEFYKPFRNQIRKFQVFDSLYVIWGFSRNYTFDKPFPSDIERPGRFNPFEADKFLRKYWGLFDHELDFLAREIILHADTVRTTETLRNRKNFHKLLNYLRGTIEEEISRRYGGVHNIIIEFHRIAHRQFRWQIAYSRPLIFRYYQIYSAPAVNDLVLTRTGLTTQQLFMAGFLLFIMTAENFRTQLPFNSTSRVLTSEMINSVVRLFGTTLDDLRSSMKQHHEVSENLFYTYNPINDKPFIIDNNILYCPIPLLAFWRFTSGLYYTIVSSENNFSEAFGNSFQYYIGSVINKCCISEDFIVFPEERFGTPEKRTTDWAITSSDSVLFIECKTKRMTVVSKASLDISDALRTDIRKLAEAITQTYNTYLDYQNDEYPTLKYNSTLDFIPIVVTLEDWFININHTLMDVLGTEVRTEFTRKGISHDLLTSNPFHIRSAAELERDLQIINALGVREYFRRLSENTIQDYIQDFVFQDLFEGEFERVFMAPLRDSDFGV